MIKRLLLSCLFLLTIFSVNGQVGHIARYEFPHEWNNQDHIVIPNEEKGVLLVQPMSPGTAKNVDIQYRYLDKNLKEAWTGFFEVSRRLYLKGYHYVDGMAYLLFQNRNSQRYIKLVTLDLDNKKVDSYEPKQIVELDIQEFEVIKKTVIIGGYIESRPAVFAYDLAGGNVRTLPNVYQNNSDLLEVRINRDSLTFNVVASEINDAKDRTILVNTYDYKGNAVRDYQLETEEGHQLLSGISSSIIDRTQTIVGLYSIKTGTYPSGIYVNHVDRTGKQTMKYYYFGEFETFLDHVGEKRATRLKEKALSARENNREWRYKTDALFREIIEEDGKLIVAGEFFKPWTVSTDNYWRNRTRFSRFADLNNTGIGTFQGQGLGRIPTTPVQGGVRSDFNFTHAFALVLDEKGEVQWDSSFEIEENVDGALEDFGAFQWHENKGFYAFYHDKELVVKYLNDKESQEGNKSELELIYDDDKLKFERDLYRGISRWYGNKYLIYGLQHVRSDETKPNIRKVFFINAITVGPDFEPTNDD
ncbi:hypothetical protein [Roseivirga misakiensis]|uniref:Uncharacterized protein n=1 Tax=Roseivirga misakiensis TaxID=1563681 RepID=A0A1E5T383_9BACT|nr:hypothetical protein [Roseivirga misakiensis]OEK05727.1 hypothetical protein BFP71_06280 [Roseivirga misakiensis]